MLESSGVRLLLRQLVHRARLRLPVRLVLQIGPSPVLRRSGRLLGRIGLQLGRLVLG
ncbi:hypothetical protein [Kribbella sp. DT2]|uniref:hypothetical protein n=1 Tax=Kribbella sp. DT2 TaxID=3393427 RepID=UPI003CF5794C